jgi:predicted nucleotidyltransferase
LQQISRMTPLSRPALSNLPEYDMKPSIALNQHRIEIRRIVAANRASNARVFGSVVHGTDAEGSDLDILIDPTPETTLFDIGAHPS